MTDSAAAIVLGDGEFRFSPVDGWAQLPAGLEVADAAGIAVTAADQVVLFMRGPVPVVILDKDGSYVDSWGEGLFVSPHGAAVGPDGALYLTDGGAHTVRKFTVGGELLLELGSHGIPADFMSGRPFHRCTHTTVTPAGEILVSDGYGNAAIHRYSATGEYLGSWGSSGARAGQFNVPHNLACDGQGRVYVADRENHRVQVFDSSGGYLFQIGNMFRPSGLTITPGDDPTVLVGEMASYLAVNREAPGLEPRISLFRTDGEVVTTLEREPPRGTGPGQFLSPHALAMDSDGSLYVGEVGSVDWEKLCPDVPKPSVLRGFQKLQRI